MTVGEIVRHWLKDHGYDGLYCPGECSCGLDDLMPCGGGSLWDAYDCHAGHVVPCPGSDECEFADDAGHRHIGKRT